MCGVVGYNPVHNGFQLQKGDAFRRLFIESTVRGLHAFGLYQPPGPVVKSNEVEDVLSAFDPMRPGIAHARYSTSGDWRMDINNQPIMVCGMALAFNGVIHMGTREEFSRDFEVPCETGNDGEVFLRCLDRGEGTAEFLGRITGSFAGCWIDQAGAVHAGRNERRPLWRCWYLGAFWYASTRDIFLRAEFPALDATLVPVGIE